MTAPTAARDAMAAGIPVENMGRVPLRLSWGAVFAGLLIAVVLQLVLSVLGAAIGLAAWDPNSGKALGIGAAIWALVSILVALYVGGATAGWIAGALTRGVALLHGTLVWALSTLIMVWLVASGISTLAGTTFHVLGSVLGATAGVAVRGVTAAAGAAVGNGNIDLGTLRAQVDTILRQTGNPALQPGSLGAAARRAESTATSTPASNAGVVDTIVTMIQQRAGTVDRNDVINVLVARGMSRPDAERMADRVVALGHSAAANLDTLTRRAGQKAANVAESAADVTSTALWVTLLGLGISLAAAALGAAGSARMT